LLIIQQTLKGEQMIRTGMITACAVILAMGAAWSSAARGEATEAVFTYQQYPLTVHGENPAGDTTFTTEAGSVVCDRTLTSGLLGEAIGQTLSLTPTLTNCKAFGFASATVSTEGCSYLYHITTKLSEDSYQASMDVVCPTGKSIKVTAGNCKVEVAGQTGLKNVALDNVRVEGEPRDIMATDEIEGVAYTVTQDGFACPFAGTGNRSDGQFDSHSPTTLDPEPGTIYIR
jgi:hypothetical protein